MGGQKEFLPDIQDDRCCTLCVHRKYHPSRERNENTSNKFILERDCCRQNGEPLHFKVTSAMFASGQSRARGLAFEFGVILSMHIVCTDILGSNSSVA